MTNNEMSLFMQSAWNNAVQRWRDDLEVTHPILVRRVCEGCEQLSVAGYIPVYSPRPIGCRFWCRTCLAVTVWAFIN